MKLTQKIHLPKPFRTGPILALATAQALCSYAMAQDDSDEEIFELSPFEVSADEDDIGYRQQNTLAGSRMRTNIADIAASITVVTKEQIEDTASLDVNDLFRYEAGTEGSSTYTPGTTSSRGDGLADTNAGFAAGFTGATTTNASSNTVRGLGSPDSSVNFYRAVKQIPLDSYNVQSVEISRGPNSMLFGVGSPAGVVNQTRLQANLDDDSLGVKFRFDDNGSQRASLTFNKSLIEGKLAIAGALLADRTEFVRKPSYDESDRFYAAITYKPFEKTTLKVNFESYENENNRPNTITPIDYVTEWQDAGRPVYDSQTRTVTYLDSGEVVGPYTREAGSPSITDTQAYVMSLSDYDASLWADENMLNYNGVNIYGYGAMTNPNSPLYVPALRVVTGRPTMQVADGQIQNWFFQVPAKYRSAFGESAGPTSADIYANAANAAAYDQNGTSSNLYSQLDTNLVRAYYPGVTDQSIYDWTEVNTLQMNFGSEEATTYNLEFEQQFTDELYFSAGWFHQEFENVASYTVSQLNAPALYVDTNMYLPDGSDNPYYLGVYMQDVDPDQFSQDVENDQYRAMLAYTPDFTGNDGWTKWLGSHQFIALASKEEQTLKTERLRLFLTDSNEVDLGMINYMPDQSVAGYNYERSRIRRTFYLSTPGTEAMVNTGSGTMTTPFTANQMVYNWEDSEWTDVSYSMAFHNHQVGTSAFQNEITSWNIGGTSRLWNDRIIATYGIRNDKDDTRSTSLSGLTNEDKWTDGYINKETLWNNYADWQTWEKDTSTLGIVFRPFSGWKSIDSRANQFSEFLNSLAFTYNTSDTFNPPDVSYVDGFGTQLPIPSGEGKDYGIQFSMFENKLFARLSKFEASNENAAVRAQLALARYRDLIDVGQFRSWARTIAKINMGLDPTDSAAFSDDILSDADETAVQNAAAAIWGQNYDYYNELGGTLGQTSSVAAEGYELQINYNPMPNWTIKATATKEETINDNIAPEFTAWYNERNPIMASAQASDYLDSAYQGFATYTTDGGTAVDLSNFLTSYGYNSTVRADDAVNGWTNVTNYYNLVVNPAVLSDRALAGTVVANQPRYKWNLITNYKFTDDKLKGVSVGGSYRWIGKKAIGYYGQSSGVTEGVLDIPDIDRPIYTPAESYVDFWAAYSRKIRNESIDMKIQLNVVNAFESGHLQTVAVDFNGSPYGYRIVDPRKFILSLSFDM
ncbi:TonB-dependent receptor [Pelagicoccus albus]|uniref:TonB-dependent receptor plug domain-containing protein n=1 Tax=Pelagicoccus albus TaxID=415222 RepID=A0A7X1E6X3_9BACT|nr:TonB-dependent receptor [Pelagicoccus albus]MBC2604729.1 TonB-dependent receptor plug domain-containing protein [Pelagicoccus albus]